MKKPLVILLILFCINLILLGRFAVRLVDAKSRAGAISKAIQNRGTELLETSNQAPQPKHVKSPTRSPTPFKQIYSSNLKEFASNLRAIGCPEETVKDILVAEVKSQFKAREETVRPKPADCVPLMWAPTTSEARLLKRRLEAAKLAREKAALLSEALGYYVPVDMPLFATRAGDLQFEQANADASPERRKALTQAQDTYWGRAEALQNRTHGFWLPEDVAELKRAKAEWRQVVTEGGVQ